MVEELLSGKRDTESFGRGWRWEFLECFRPQRSTGSSICADILASSEECRTKLSALRFQLSSFPSKQGLQSGRWAKAWLQREEDITGAATSSSFSKSGVHLCRRERSCLRPDRASSRHFRPVGARLRQTSSHTECRFACTDLRLGYPPCGRQCLKRPLAQPYFGGTDLCRFPDLRFDVHRTVAGCRSYSLPLMSLLIWDRYRAVHSRTQWSVVVEDNIALTLSRLLALSLLLPQPDDRLFAAWAKLEELLDKNGFKTGVRYSSCVLFISSGSREVCLCASLPWTVWSLEAAARKTRKHPKQRAPLRLCAIPQDTWPCTPSVKLRKPRQRRRSGLSMARSKFSCNQQAEELYELVDQYWADYRRLQGIAGPCRIGAVSLRMSAPQPLAGVWKSCCQNATKVLHEGEKTTESVLVAVRWPPRRPPCSEEKAEGKSGAS